ncbi:non-histone chromosomal protein 6 [Lentinula edodes]|uniref:Non-histone chromosomal protein 6 n=1 Tax=Lentinula edodes TaxID=5353 RepID=A0A1Q3ELZ6_LENED|nr:uncharacterized protein C8R40DRAFT_1102100 [Lentinula edodes]KAH7875975.1 hypothetical protein C8R40DRAFT_1102100 [Lentinula edodes]GAW08225.1 non-histone chromosomal protein 6 [Lentinula edodes]
MAPTVDELRAQYTDSLMSVAQSMREAAQAAEEFAKAIGTPSLINGHTKGKGKTGDEEVINGKRKRVKKDPNAPKRPASSFFLFQNQIRQKVKEQHPDLPTAELRKLMSEQWSTLPEDQKNHYKQLAEELKVVYSEEKEKYNARSPEQVAAADAVVAAAAATKKAPKSRKPTATDAPVVAKKPVIPPVYGSDESDNESSEDDKVKLKTGKPTKNAPAPPRKGQKSEPFVPDSDEDDEEEDEDESDQVKQSSDEEEEEEEEEQPPTKKSKTKHHDKPVSRRK